MRILHLVSYPLYSGPLPGTLALALAQRRLGHTVWLACDTRRGNFDGFEEAAEPHLRAAHLEPPTKVPLTLSTHASLSQHWGDYRALRGLLRPSAVDIVHVHLSHDHALGALSRDRALPLVRTIHAARAMRRRLGQRWLLARADHFIVRSQAHNDALGQMLPAKAGCITTIPGSIDADAWRRPEGPGAQAERQAWRAQYQVPQDAPLLGHVALIADRGQDVLLKALIQGAFSAAADVHVVFVGDGEGAHALKAAVMRHNLGHRVHFTGYLHSPELKRAYAAMDAAYVMQPGNDAAARAVLEAMAQGLPVLAPQTDALGELVSAQTGYVLTSRGPEAVAQGLGAWLENLEQGRLRGQRGAAFVRAHRPIAHEAQASIAVYSRCLARRLHAAQPTKSLSERLRP